MPPPPTPTQQTTTNFFNTVLNPNANHPTATPPRPARPFEQPQHQFSTTQRSLQARNKNYNISDAGGRKEKEAESYEQRQRREEAARILESTEMLIWYSNARNESIPQTRHHYQNIVLGIAQSEDVVWKEEWEIEDIGRGVVSPRSAKGKEKDGGRERGKKRVSLGAHG